MLVKTGFSVHWERTPVILHLIIILLSLVHFLLLFLFLVIDVAASVL